MRVALISSIVSRQKAEPFIVRIEEPGRADSIQSKEQESLDLLKKFAIEPDQLFYQSDNLGRYQQFALSLLKQGKAFACICTEEALKADKAAAKRRNETYRYSDRCLHDQENITARIAAETLPYTIRIKKPEESIVFIDKIKGEIRTEAGEIDSFVILDTEGSPTRNFASACSEILTDISTVIRGEDHLTSTPREIHVKHALGYTAQTAYAHLPAIHTEETTADRDAPVLIRELLAEGFLPDAIINYLLLAGNTPPTEHFVLPDTVAWFDFSGISEESVAFDKGTLHRLNRNHLEAMDDKKLSTLFGFADADIGKLLKLYLGEADTISVLDGRIKAIFAPKHCDGDAAAQMQALATLIYEAPMFDAFEDFIQYLITQSGIEQARLLTLLRLLITATPDGPRLEDIYPLIKPYITEIARCTP